MYPLTLIVNLSIYLFCQAVFISFFQPFTYLSIYLSISLSANRFFPVPIGIQAKADLAAYLGEAKEPVQGLAADLHRLSLTVPTTELRAETCIRFEQMAALVWAAAVVTEAGN